jgi:hypothetical protein
MENLTYEIQMNNNGTTELEKMMHDGKNCIWERNQI